MIGKLDNAAEIAIVERIKREFFHPLYMFELSPFMYQCVQFDFQLLTSIGKKFFKSVH